MFCPACGIPTTPGLSFCNRCGAGLRERSETTVKTGAIIAFLFAITAIALGGLGIMLGGAIALKKEAGVSEDLVGGFMFMTCCMIVLIEIFLVRQLSRVSGRAEKRKALPAPMQNELRPGAARGLPEPIPSVTENTTRTLEYSRNEPLR